MVDSQAADPTVNPAWAQRLDERSGGYSSFGHPVEIQDIYRELDRDSSALARPPLPKPLNPPPEMPIPPWTAGRPAKRLWEWQELTLVATPSADQTFIASDIPEVWWVTTDFTAATRIRVYPAANSNAATKGFLLGIGGELVIPATDRFLTISNVSASTGLVMVRAVAGWRVSLKHTIGT